MNKLVGFALLSFVVYVVSGISITALLPIINLVTKVIAMLESVI